MPLPYGSLTQTAFSLPLPSSPFPPWGPSPSLPPRRSLSSPLCRFPVRKAYFSRRPFCASASLPLVSTVPSSAVSRARFRFSPPDVRSSTLSGARRWVGAQGRGGRGREMSLYPWGWPRTGSTNGNPKVCGRAWLRISSPEHTSNLCGSCQTGLARSVLQALPLRRLTGRQRPEQRDPGPIRGGRPDKITDFVIVFLLNHNR